MKMSELLDEPEIFGARISSKITAEIAVILPVYNFSSEKLKKVLASILFQKGTNYELIIVGEGPISDEIKEYIFQLGTNVSLLLFKNRLGLPPVSFYYGYLKSLSEYFIFSNQDFIFSENIFRDLYNTIKESNYKIIFGTAKDSEIKESQKISDIRHLNSRNIFSLSAAMIHRSVFEHIGLFDPHPLLYNYFDWDFWLRVSSQYSIRQTDLFAGERNIDVNATLFGMKYSSEYCARKIMMVDRSNELLLDNYSKLDMFRKFNNKLDEVLLPYIEDIKTRLKKKSNLIFEVEAIFKSKCRKIFVLSPKEPSPFYPFFALGETENVEVIFGDLNSGIKSKELVSADLVIINRYLLDFLPVISKLNQLNIPWVYFIDDNFTLLAQEGYLRGFEWYTYNNLRTYLSTAAAVFVSTDALKKEYERKALHHRLYVFQPIISDRLLQSSSKFFQETSHQDYFHVAMIGGRFRYENFIQVVLPALLKLSESIKIVLWSVCDIPSSIKLPEAIEIKKLCMQADYEQFILSLAPLSIDCIVHPYGATEDIPYKTDAVILVSRYLDANIIVGNEPCFEKISENDGVLKVENTTQSFYDAFFKLTDKRIQAQKIKEKIAYCDRHYSRSLNEAPLRDFLSTISPVSFFEVERRERVMSEFFFERGELTRAEEKEPLKIAMIIDYIKNKGIKSFLKAAIRKLILKIKGCAILTTHR